MGPKIGKLTFNASGIRIRARKMIVGSIHARASAPRVNYDAIADDYDRSRPSYPDELVDDILTFAAAPPGARILEIGCGTGQATTSFAVRGFRMVCLEPGPALVAIARKRLKPFDQIEVICQTFEAWPAERRAFDMVLSATAFHWVSRRVRFAKAARVLRPGGVLAVFNSVACVESAPLPDDVKRIMKRPSVSANASQPWPFERQFRDSRAFGPSDKRVYLTRRTYDAQGLESLLSSFNRFRELPVHEQTAVMGLARAAVASQGGIVPLDFQVRLVMARLESIGSNWRRRFALWLHRAE